MKRRRFIRKARKPAALGILLSAGALMLHACGASAEPAPQPDPAEVERFLLQLEEEQATLQSAEAGSNRNKRLRSLVEGAATRAPSAAVISKLEDVVSEKLG